LVVTLPTIHAYSILERVPAEGRAAIYRALSTRDGRAVLVKVIDPRRCDPRDIDRIRHEYELGRAIHSRAVVKPLELQTQPGMLALVLEDFGGQSLEGLLGTPIPVDLFLRLAIQITTAVVDVHREGAIHKDIRPANILINPVTLEVKIGNLGLASRLLHEEPRAGPPRLIEGSLPYLSPEQTGWANRAVDKRTDLYALGVTFFQMLTGRLPFEAQDPVAWVHCHLACVPKSPSELSSEIPPQIGRIVLKLLSKRPEDRYQTAAGLRDDWKRCRIELSRQGSITAFELGRHDAADTLEISQTLHGREAQVLTLLGAFRRVLTSRKPELLLVSGYPGIGKTALVRELYDPIVEQRGLFVAGKFEENERDVPLSTFVKAFRQLVLDILSGGQEEVSAWQERLTGALGPDGAVVADIIPPLRLLIGPQPPAPELPPRESKNRFRAAFRRLTSAFARRGQPLVLFLDDVQWADPASLELVREMVTSPDEASLLVICAYRSNEVTPLHPVALTIGQIRGAGAEVSATDLGPLSYDDVVSLAAEALHGDAARVAPLAELVCERTGGNPFFVRQFLTELYEEKLVELDPDTHGFRWDLEKIRAKGFTDNVVSLLVGKLRRLSPTTQQVLTHLACFGSQGDAEQLALVCDDSPERAHADLWEAVAAGLLVREGETYRFVHDHVKDAAYALIPEERRPEVHLKIGRLFRSRWAGESIGSHIFDVIGHLNLGVMLVPSSNELEQIAELNLVAGGRAKASTAYGSALKYFAFGASLLDETSWERRYPLRFALELQRAECEYLTGELLSAEQRLSALASRVKNTVDLAAVTCARELLYWTLDRSDRAIEVCLDYLRTVGVDWSPHPTEEDVRQEFEKVWDRLGDRPIEALALLPEVEDRASSGTMDVFTCVLSAALITNEKLHCLIAARMTSFSVEHGNSDASCLAYARIGTVLGPRFGQYDIALRFAQVGLDLVEQRGLLHFQVRVYLDYAQLVMPWTRPMRSGLERMRKALVAAQQTGSPTDALFARNSLLNHLLAVGEPLDKVQAEAESALQFVRDAKFGHAVDILAPKHALVRTLRGLTREFSSFDDAGFEEAAFERHLENDGRQTIAACWYWIRKLQGRFYAGHYSTALEAAAKAEPLLWTTSAFPEVVEWHFFRALALAARHDEVPADGRQGLRDALAIHHQRLRTWAENSPENFGGRAALVEAEIARIDGDPDVASALYDEAVCLARENGFVQTEAVAQETAARFYRARGFDFIGDAYAREARESYLRWGADGKARDLERAYPQLIERRPIGPGGTLRMRSEDLDLVAVTRASQAISGEIVLDRLVHTLLAVALAEGGAQRGCIMLCGDDDILHVEAEASLEETGVRTRVIGAVPLANAANLVPAGLALQAQRTKERVILNDAFAETGRLSSDEYFARRRPRSALCMPIVRQARAIGVLYLENNLLPGAFSPSRLAAIELLAAQAAISLENARLLAKEREARAAAERAERRASFIAEAGALISESLGFQETLARLGELCVHSLADWCVIDIAEGREVRRVFSIHANPAKQPLLQQLQQSYAPHWDSAQPAAVVLRTGKPIVIPEMSDELLRPMCADDAHFELLRRLGMRTLVALPLASRGQIMGVLSLVSEAQDPKVGGEDLDLACAVAQRAATAIDHARLYAASETAVRLRSEFLSVASHELKTPLTSLVLGLQHLQRVARHPERAAPEPSGVSGVSKLSGVTIDRLLEVTLRQGARLGALVDDLLDVSQLESQARLPLHLQEVDLSVLVRQVLERFEGDLRQTGSRVSLAAGLRVVGRWDRPRIDRVVTNLLSNAIKFGAGRPIEVIVERRGDTARLVVRDHGMGIEPEEIDRIFGRFERAVSARNYGGLGLGLYICRRLVEEHGGSIRCESRPDAGATFVVDLPCVPPS
jgi:predicted ATPase/signal transduction histidine kinase